MSDPARSGERAQLLNLLDRLDAVDRARAPRPFLPELIIDKWRRGDPEARRTIEKERRGVPPAHDPCLFCSVRALAPQKALPPAGACERA
jgi:hypothetical protein